MKRTYPFLTFVLITLISSFVFSLSVQAQESHGTSTESTSATPHEPEALTDPTPADAPDTEQIELPKPVQDRIYNLVTNVLNRLSATLTRMDSITSRLDSRITKMKASGMETGSAEAKLAEAKSALTHAHETFTSIPPLMEVLSGKTPLRSYHAVRVQLLSIRNELKTISQLLTETISLLKAPTPTNQTPATSTESLPAQS